MRHAAVLVLLLLTAPSFSQEPPEIVLPQLPAPQPTPQPGAVVVLNTDILYVIRSNSPFFVLSSPDGLVTVSPETGPLRIRGRFAEEPTKTVTKSFPEKYLVIVEAARTGQTELIVVPSGVTDQKRILRQLLSIQATPQPPPEPPTPPTPPTPPVPPTPAPIPVAGLNMLIVEEVKDRNKLPPGQLQILFDKRLRDYINSKNPPVNGDPHYRIWDQNDDATNELKMWRDAFARPRQSVPWLIISNGKSGFEGPLPKTVQETLDLLKKYGEQ